MRTVAALVLVLMCPALAWAQAKQPPPDEKEWIPPPLIEAPPEEPAKKEAPPPPAAPPPTPSPPAQPQAAQTPPGPEVGLMISEAAFGMLTSAGASLLTYYLFLKNLQGGGGLSLGGDAQTVADVLLMVVFSGVPLAVAQTELGIANSSHYYSSELWPAALAGLGAQAAVLGLYFLVRDSLGDRGEAVLLIGTCAAVPLVQMAAINLTKTPRWQLPGGGPRGRSVFTLGEGGRLQLGLPLPSPVILRGPRGPAIGAQLSLLEGRF
ncbi:MAG TPA: hypothetical protein VE618_00755 [Myxococcaceae bacterium]|nr:hypothetical protein [Myxococcaceae bacterium]HZA50996.1 hypothetical protein [Myxococcaceae bacterium]